MEKVIWKSENIYASAVKESYELEKLIREASAKGELLCPDINCENPVLKYCHGNKRRPYFAHRYISLCDYDRYDRNNSESINNVKYLIFNQLTQKGVKIDIDKKVFEHQYAHLVVFGDDGYLAVELASDSVTSRKINRLSDQYKANGVSVQFLVIGNDVLLEDESDSNFIRRFSLNETFNNNLLVINEEGTEIYQYRLDSFKYTYCGAQLSNYQSIYYEKADFEELAFEDGILTICGFGDRYNSWFDEKQRRYKEFIVPRKTETTKPQETKAHKTDVIYEKLVTLEDAVTESIEPEDKNTIDGSKIISISDLKYIELISLPSRKPLVELFRWSEEEFIMKIRQICYESNEIAFKQLIIKMKNPNSDEKEIINCLWKRFKETRPDYFYILKTAFNKSKQ